MFVRSVPVQVYSTCCGRHMTELPNLSNLRHLRTSQKDGQALWTSSVAIFFSSMATATWPSSQSQRRSLKRRFAIWLLSSRLDVWNWSRRLDRDRYRSISRSTRRGQPNARTGNAQSGFELPFRSGSRFTMLTIRYHTLFAVCCSFVIFLQPPLLALLSHSKSYGIRAGREQKWQSSRFLGHYPVAFEMFMKKLFTWRILRLRRLLLESCWKVETPLWWSGSVGALQQSKHRDSWTPVQAKWVSKHELSTCIIKAIFALFFLFT